MTDNTSSEVIRHLLPEAGKAKSGCHEVAEGIHLEVIEEQSWKRHSHVRGSLPDGEAIESGFTAGPIFSFSCAESYVDVPTGMTIVGRDLLYEPAVSQKVIARYRGPSDADYDGARVLDQDQVVLPLASPKMKNYCRFWLDSMAKLFVYGRSSNLQSVVKAGREDIVAPKLKLAFQRDAVGLTKPQDPPWTIKRARLVRGRSINSTGIVFGGGQRVGSLVRDFSRHLDSAIFLAETTDDAGELVYISRNESSMRRVLNEDDVVPILRGLGFDIIRPGEMPLAAQIDRFRNARVIVAPHGAALTNLIFCRPGLTLIEIFPRGGVHGSMFLRIASHLDFDYYFVVGEAVDNEASRSNPNNADIVLDPDSFASFLRDIIA
jgi:capsular polysaccharide biosynthesis protein